MTNHSTLSRFAVWHGYMCRLLTFMLVAAAGITAESSAANVTADQWLISQPKPFFRSGHTLPRLTRFGYNGLMSVETRIELATNWGYALGLGQEVEPALVSRLDNPASDEARIAAKAKSDPQRYPLEVIVSFRMPGKEAPMETWVRNAEGKAINYSTGLPMDCNPCSKEADGAIFSPEAPDTVWKMAGEYRAAGLRALVARGLPVSIAIDGGERGLEFVGTRYADGFRWEKDPRIVAAVAASGLSWTDYSSERKAHAEKIIANSVHAAVPQLDLYELYPSGGQTLRNLPWNEYYDWDWKYMRGVSTLPNDQIYYRFWRVGFTGDTNVLTIATNATANLISTGDRFSYNWVNGGSPNGPYPGDDSAIAVADFSRWTGFLKCWYTVGMIGSIVIHWDYPVGFSFNASFPADNPPTWLRQLAASSHVHALFSHLEDLERASDLLPGPSKHAISPMDPAYEFPTGDKNAHVVARKHRVNSEWLLTAWAADGADRTVQVDIPVLGRVSLQARICGSVYRATLNGGNVTLVRIDEEGCTFTHAATAITQVTSVDRRNPSAFNIRFANGIVDIRVPQTSATRHISIIDPMGRMLAAKQGSGDMRITLARMGSGSRFVLVKDNAGRSAVMPIVFP